MTTATPEPLGPPTTERDRLTDQLRPVVHQAIHEQAPHWDHTFPEGNTGTVVGLADAVIVAVHATIDAGWRPSTAPIDGNQKR